MPCMPSFQMRLALRVPLNGIHIVQIDAARVDEAFPASLHRHGMSKRKHRQGLALLRSHVKASKSCGISRTKLDKGVISWAKVAPTMPAPAL